MTEHSQIDKMTVPQLREKAKGLGVEGTSGMKKDELIKAIVAIKPELAPAAHHGHASVKHGKEKKAADPAALKKEKADIRKKIAAAVKAKDKKAIRALRHRKKEIRRFFKKNPAPKPEPKAEAKAG